MGNIDSQGFEKKWAGDKKKPKKTVYSSRSKANQMALDNIHRTAHRSQEEIAATLKKGFQVPTKAGREPSPDNRSSQNRKTLRSKTPKSGFISDEDNQSRKRLSSKEENHPAKRKPMSMSSDEEEDMRRTQNDIVATGWIKNTKETSRRGANPGTREFIHAAGVEFSEPASPEVEDRPSASQKLSRDAPKPGTKEFIQAVRVQLSESVSPEPQDNPSPSQRWSISSSSKTAEPETVQPRRKFVIPTITQEEEPAIEQKLAPRSFIKPEISNSPEHKPRTKREFVKCQIGDGAGPQNEEKRKEFARRLELLKRAGADSKKAKRGLEDIGLGDGLESTMRSPPKKSATLSLAARIGEKRRIKEEENMKEEPEGDDTKDFTELDDSIPLDDAGDATCPMCHESVPYSLLMAFSDNRPCSLNTRQQAAFCIHHKRDSASTTYTGLGYPTISWDTFNTRIASHYTYISSLITSPHITPSHYRPLFASDITHGRNRTIKQSIMGTTGLGSDTARVLIPGYYGPRGARAMQEAILLRFNRELRKAAVEDNVVSARAVGGYVASVLVPELGTRLIMEDLKIGEEEARGVMEKSAAVGALVNEELRDVRSEADRALEDGGGDYD